MLRSKQNKSTTLITYSDIAIKLRRRLVQILRITQFAMVLVAAFTLIQHKFHYSFILITTTTFLFVIDWFIAKGKIQLATTTLLITLTAMLSYLAWIGSGIRDASMLGYCGVLIFSAMLGGKRLLIALVSIMMLACLLIAYGNVTGWHINTIAPINFFTCCIVITLLSVISFSTWLMACDYRAMLNELAHENSLVRDAKNQIEHLAMHDRLTHLPNRMKAQENFIEAYANAKATGNQLGIAFIDLDNLKPINDSLGHLVGDQVLQEVAQRLLKIAGDEHNVSRYGGDEFILILNNIRSEDDISAISLMILHTIAQPFIAKNVEINCTCSIGIAVAPQDGEDLDTLIKKADIAMYQSKDSGRNSFRFFDQHNNNNLLEHMNLVTSMRKALADNQFSLYYQPKLDLHSQKMVGVEALLRWQHPEYGFIPPDTFIPLAESSGVIIQLGEWVINQACDQGKLWLDAGFTHFTVAVNISSIQFKRGNIDGIIMNALERSGFPPQMLELELTESLLIEDSDRLTNTLASLRNLGLHFSIDDFGTGYSNLGYLKKFEVEFLKIDQSFVRRMEQVAEDAVIVKAIIQLANSLGLNTIAEGVETATAAALLRDMGCNFAQGYFWAKPLPPEELEKQWDKWRPS